MFPKYCLSLALLAPVLFGSPSLSVDEEKEIEARIAAFYADNNPQAMNLRFPKYSLSKKKFVSLNLDLKSEKVHSDPLLNFAGKKAEPVFQRQYCENFLKKHFPALKCDGKDSNVQPNDKVEDLTASWMKKTLYDLNEIPVSGRAAELPWSDDYWKTRWGLTSYRYSEAIEYKTYQEAIAAYFQPLSWERVVNLGPSEMAKQIVKWSPSEKYDIVVGDTRFNLTTEQKQEGSKTLGPEGNVEEWMGLCHGWAAVASMVPRPLETVTLTGAKGTSVEFYPNDIKALLTLAWANGDYESNFIGGRCDNKKPKIYPNGRLAEQNCFDNNPATFHLVLGNMLGRHQTPFVFDKTFDYEVWNQPVSSYEFTYFNPLDPSRKSKVWSEVSVPYDEHFKSRDRFQNPLTRGDKSGDASIRQVVGVIATVIYVSEYFPAHSPEPQSDELVRESYTYDLEISEKNGYLLPTGGEWHSNLHPDFMWAAKKGTNARSRFDREPIEFSGEEIPTGELTRLAAKASRQAHPLCKVLKVLVQESSGAEYACPTDRR